MKSKKFRIFFVILIAIVIIAGIFLLWNRNKLVKSQEKQISLRLSWIIEAHAAGYYVAVDKGYYANEGLNVKINLGGIDFPPVKMVASGTDDFGSESGGETIILANSESIPVKAIGVIQPGGAPAIISIKRTGIEKPIDLEGKRVAVAFGKPAEYVYRALLKKENVDTNKIKESVFKFDITPLLNGSIDAFTGFKTNQPFVIKSKKDKWGNHYVPVVIDPQKYGIRTYGLTLFTSNKMIKEHPDTVRKFLRATLKGWEYAAQHPEEAIDIMFKFTEKLQYDRKIEIEKMKAITTTMREEGFPFGAMDKTVWEEMYQRMEQYGIVKKPLNVEEVFTNDFISEIYNMQK